MNEQARQEAEDRLRRLVTGVGAKQQQAVVQEALSTVIRDKLVDPKCMVFAARNGGLTVTLVPDNGKTDVVEIHSHALGQLADKSKPGKNDPAILRKQMWDLLGGEHWHRELLAHMLNTFYTMGVFVDRRKNKGKFLTRIVGDELRGFLSRSYNRNLNTAVSLRTFLEACAQHDAGPYEASSTSVRTRLKCVQPHVYEPVPGEFVAFGVAYGNSDFGAGTLSISNFLIRVNSIAVSRGHLGHATVLEKGFSKTHLGSVIKESDIEVSDETAVKEVEAVNSAIRDAVAAQLNIDSIERMLEAIRVADKEQIPWKTMAELLSSVLNKQEVETAMNMLDMGVQDLPPVPLDTGGVRKTSNWWASNLVGWFAEKEANLDRKAELQTFAGNILVGS